MPEPKYISNEEAAKILNVAPRTIRRYLKLKKLDPTYVQGKFGQELRLNEEQVRSLARGMTKGAEALDRLGHEGMATNGHSPLSLDPLVLWDAYEALQTEHRNMAAQLGFFSAKADEVKLLTERAESLSKLNHELADKLNLEETEIRKQKALFDATEAQLQQVKSQLEDDRASRDTLVKKYQAQLRRQVWTSLAIVILALFAGLVVSSAIAGNLSGLIAGR